MPLPEVHYGTADSLDDEGERTAVYDEIDDDAELPVTPRSVIAILGFTFYFYAVMLMRARAEVLRRDRGGSWVRELLAAQESRS